MKRRDTLRLAILEKYYSNLFCSVDRSDQGNLACRRARVYQLLALRLTEWLLMRRRAPSLHIRPTTPLLGSHSLCLVDATLVFRSHTLSVSTGPGKRRKISSRVQYGAQQRRHCPSCDATLAPSIACYCAVRYQRPSAFASIYALSGADVTRDSANLSSL